MIGHADDSTRPHTATPALPPPRGPIRRVVTRSGRQPRGYALSTGPFEGLLERDAQLVLASDPRFQRLVPQPYRVRYIDDGQERWHVPDLLAEAPSLQVVVEVKPDAKARRAEVQRRTCVMQEIFAARGAHYVLWPASAIRREPRLANARLLLNLSSGVVDEVLGRRLRHLVDTAPGLTIEAAAGRLGANSLLPLYVALAHKVVVFDRAQPLGADTPLLPNPHGRWA